MNTHIHSPPAVETSQASRLLARLIAKPSAAVTLPACAESRPAKLWQSATAYARRVMAGCWRDAPSTNAIHAVRLKYYSGQPGDVIVIEPKAIPLKRVIVTIRMRDGFPLERGFAAVATVGNLWEYRAATWIPRAWIDHVEVIACDLAGHVSWAMRRMPTRPRKTHRLPDCPPGASSDDGEQVSNQFAKGKLANPHPGQG